MSMIKELTISGYRGFGKEQTIKFAIPDNIKAGSGLTIITGANNTGKTTIIESIQAFNGHETPSFSEGKRNINTQSKVSISLIDDQNKKCSITSLPNRGSSTKRVPEEYTHKSYVIPSRRAVEYEFSNNLWDRDTFITEANKLKNRRSPFLETYEARIFQIERMKPQFDEIIQEVLGTEFNWTIEQRDSGQYYIKYIQDEIAHSSEGIGDGIWSVFTICAAFFDANPGDLIIIDEPELSIHPALQKRLLELILRYSKTMQIIICTHSPYFIDWNAIVNGAQLLRIVKENGNTVCYSISETSRKKSSGVLHDLNNPHTLGLEANEVFFCEDSVILVEGQEDVVIFKKIVDELGMNIKGNFFGWGVGGAEKMRMFLQLFKDLGYKRIVAVLDGDKKDLADALKNEFNCFQILTLREDDIRDKNERSIKAKTGITKQNGKLKDENREYMRNLIQDINDFFVKQ